MSVCWCPAVCDQFHHPDPVYRRPSATAGLPGFASPGLCTTVSCGKKVLFLYEKERLRFSICINEQHIVRSKTRHRHFVNGLLKVVHTSVLGHNKYPDHTITGYRIKNYGFSEAGLGYILYFPISRVSVFFWGRDLLSENIPACISRFCLVHLLPYSRWRAVSSQSQDGSIGTDQFEDVSSLKGVTTTPFIKEYLYAPRTCRGRVIGCETP